MRESGARLYFLALDREDPFRGLCGVGLFANNGLSSLRKSCVPHRENTSILGKYKENLSYCCISCLFSLTLLSLTPVLKSSPVQLLDRNLQIKSLFGVIGSVYFVGAAVGGSTVLISARVEAMGLSEAHNGIIGAMFPLAAVTVGWFMPGLIGRLGVVRSLFFALLTGGLANLLFGFIPNYYVWLGLRFVTGAASALYWTASETWVNGVTQPSTRGRILGVYSGMLAAGLATGPFVIDALGTIEGALPFAMIALFTALSAVPPAMFPKAAPSVSEHDHSGIVRLIMLAPVLMIAALMSGYADTTLAVLLPVYTARIGLVESQLIVTGIFFAGNIVLQVPLGWLADVWGRKQILYLCVLGCLTGAVLLPFAATDAMLFWPMIFCWGGLSFGIYTIGLTMLGDRFTVGRLPTANAAYVMLYEVGGVMGPLLSGSAMAIPLFGPNGLALGVGSAAFLYFLFAVFWRGRSAQFARK